MVMALIFGKVVHPRLDAPRAELILIAKKPHGSRWLGSPSLANSSSESLQLELYLGLKWTTLERK